MVQSDALSCRSDFYLDEDNDNEDVTLLPDNLFANLIDLDLQRRIVASDSYDWTAADAIKLLQADGPSAAQADLSDWTVEHVYVPKDIDIRREIVAQYHDIPTVYCRPPRRT